MSTEKATSFETANKTGEGRSFNFKTAVRQISWQIFRWTPILISLSLIVFSVLIVQAKYF